MRLCTQNDTIDEVENKWQNNNSFNAVVFKIH